MKTSPLKPPFRMSHDPLLSTTRVFLSKSDPDPSIGLYLYVDTLIRCRRTFPPDTFFVFFVQLTYRAPTNPTPLSRLRVVFPSFFSFPLFLSSLSFTLI